MSENRIVFDRTQYDRQTTELNDNAEMFVKDYIKILNEKLNEKRDYVVPDGEYRTMYEFDAIFNDTNKHRAQRFATAVEGMFYSSGWACIITINPIKKKGVITSYKYLLRLIKHNIDVSVDQ